MAPPPGTFGSFVVNTYSTGTGHVDITLFSAANGDPSSVIGTFGLNVHGYPNGAGATDGGWFKEDDVLANAQSDGTLQYQSPPRNVSYDSIMDLYDSLSDEANANGQLGSPGYWLWGNNCVDGVSNSLSRLNVNDNVYSYMKPSSLGVYAYAAATNTSVIIPTPQGAVNVETNPYKVVAGYLAHVAEYAAQEGASIVNWLVGLIGSNSQADDGTPQSITTGQIVVSVNRDNHTATAIYDQNLVDIYDSNGKYISSGVEYGLPQDLINAINLDLSDLQDAFPNG